MSIPDPLEEALAACLDELGEPYDRNDKARGLDFWLAFHDLFIEVKRFATPRIADQLARVDGRDAVVLMGAGALAKLRAVFGPDPVPPARTPDRQALIAALIAAWPDGERFIVVDTRSGQAAALTDDQMDAFRRWFPRPADPQAAEID